MNEVATIKSYLLLGSASARTDQFLRDHQITFVVNAANNIASTEKCIVPQLKIKCNDSESEDLSKYFDIAADAMHAELTEKGNKVYVHCYGGISRGPSLVMAYLMKYEELSLLDAHTMIKEKRRFVRPNIGFWKQLIQYENKIRGTNSVTIQSKNNLEFASVYNQEYENLVAIRNSKH